MAAALKWLVAMRAFQAVVDPYLVPCGSQPVVPCGLQPVVQPPEVILATGIMEAVRACNGDAMQQMHHELTRRSGRAGRHSGLIWLLRRLGFGQQQAEALKTFLHEAGQVRLPASGGKLSQQHLREYGDSVTQASGAPTLTQPAGSVADAAATPHHIGCYIFVWQILLGGPQLTLKPTTTPPKQ